MITSEQLRAARALLRWDQAELSRASGVSLPSIKRLETKPGVLAAQARTVEALVQAFERAGVTFLQPGTASPAGGPGVRLRREPT